jgi:hypothetical protein
MGMLRGPTAAPTLVIQRGKHLDGSITQAGAQRLSAAGMLEM